MCKAFSQGGRHLTLDDHDTCADCVELEGVVLSRIRGTDDLHVFPARPDVVGG